MLDGFLDSDGGSVQRVLVMVVEDFGVVSLISTKCQELSDPDRLRDVIDGNKKSYAGSMRPLWKCCESAELEVVRPDRASLLRLVTAVSDFLQFCDQRCHHKVTVFKYPMVFHNGRSIAFNSFDGEVSFSSDAGVEMVVQIDHPGTWVPLIPYFWDDFQDSDNNYTGVSAQCGDKESDSELTL